MLVPPAPLHCTTLTHAHNCPILTTTYYHPKLLRMAPFARNKQRSPTQRRNQVPILTNASFTHTYFPERSEGSGLRSELGHLACQVNHAHQMERQMTIME